MSATVPSPRMVAPEKDDPEKDGPEPDDPDLDDAAPADHAVPPPATPSARAREEGASPMFVGIVELTERRAAPLAAKNRWTKKSGSRRERRSITTRDWGQGLGVRG